MNVTSPPRQSPSTGEVSPSKGRWATLWSWLLSWEIYIIVIVAAFLRLYRMDTSEFSGDQTILFRMAYDAVHYGLIPATSNGSSIHTMNPPLAVYFLMIPAAISSNPLWATVWTGLFNVAAVLLAYIFTRRYYGRLAATIAAALYTTAQTTIVFSRFIWQPSLIAPFTVLFLFALFWGGVEHRKGWLFPALLLLGVLSQLHSLTLFLIVPLFVAILLAPKTIRLRDVILGGASLLILYAPYLVWEKVTHFYDIKMLFAKTSTPAHIDNRAWVFYERFLNAFYYDDKYLHGTIYDPTAIAHSAVFPLLQLLVAMRYILEACLFGGFALAVWAVLRNINFPGKGKARNVPFLDALDAFGRQLFSSVRTWWRNLRADPLACGMLLMLLWQIVPVLGLTRHGPPIHLHYLLVIVPGPFIFIAVFITRALKWFGSQQSLQQPAWLWKSLRYGTYVAISIVLLIQLIGSSASLIDMTNGINNHIFGYNDIGSLEHAFQEADQMAQEHHISRVYGTLSVIDDFDSLLVGFPYLASLMHTPSTLFEASRCAVLPSPQEGPAVVLTRSTDTLTPVLLKEYGKTVLVDEPPILGSTPFKLYIVTPYAYGHTVSRQSGFTNQLQEIDSQVQQLGGQFPPTLVTRWTLLHSAQAQSRVTYNYIMRAIPRLPGAVSVTSTCLLTSMRPGDQLIATFPLSQSAASARSFSISSQYLVQTPYVITLGPLHFETFQMQGTPELLQSTNGTDTLTVLS